MFSVNEPLPLEPPATVSNPTYYALERRTRPHCQPSDYSLSACVFHPQDIADQFDYSLPLPLRLWKRIVPDAIDYALRTRTGMNVSRWRTLDFSKRLAEYFSRQIISAALCIHMGLYNQVADHALPLLPHTDYKDEDFHEYTQIITRVLADWNRLFPAKMEEWVEETYGTLAVMLCEEFRQVLESWGLYPSWDNVVRMELPETYWSATSGCPVNRYSLYRKDLRDLDVDRLCVRLPCFTRRYFDGCYTHPLPPPQYAQLELTGFRDSPRGPGTPNWQESSFRYLSRDYSTPRGRQAVSQYPELAALYYREPLQSNVVDGQLTMYQRRKKHKPEVVPEASRSTPPHLTHVRIELADEDDEEMWEVEQKIEVEEPGFEDGEVLG